MVETGGSKPCRCWIFFLEGIGNAISEREWFDAETPLDCCGWSQDRITAVDPNLIPQKQREEVPCRSQQREILAKKKGYKVRFGTWAKFWFLSLVSNIYLTGTVFQVKWVFSVEIPG